MNLQQAERDYRNDATFRAVVDTIMHWVLDAQVSPAEARAAAMLACVKVEERRMRPHFYAPSSSDGEGQT